MSAKRKKWDEVGPMQLLSDKTLAAIVEAGVYRYEHTPLMWYFYPAYAELARRSNYMLEELTGSYDQRQTARGRSPSVGPAPWDNSAGFRC